MIMGTYGDMQNFPSVTVVSLHFQSFGDSNPPKYMPVYAKKKIQKKKNS